MMDLLLVPLLTIAVCEGANFCEWAIHSVQRSRYMRRSGKHFR